MARSQRTKLTLKDIGEPAMVKTLPADQNQYVLGTLVCIVSGIIKRTNQKAGMPGEPDTFEGLAGSFRVIPSDPKKDELESGILFVPDAFHNMIAQEFRTMSVNDENAKVKCAFEVSSIRAANPAGYSWDFRPMGDALSSNPIDDFLNEAKVLEHVGTATTLAITDRSKKATDKKKK
jgi:hypothetical protein